MGQKDSWSRHLAVSACIAALLAGCVQTGTTPAATTAAAENAAVRQVAGRTLTLGPEQRRQPLWRAMAQISDGNLKGANAILNEALSANPGNANMHFLNAYVYEVRGREEGLDVSELAPAGYLAAFNTDGHHWAAAYRLGVWHLHHREYGLAIRWLGEAAMIKDDSPEILTALAVASYMNFDPEGARAFLQRAVALTGDTPANLRSRAILSAALGDMEKADGYLDEFRDVGSIPEVRRAQARVRQWDRFRRYAETASDPGRVQQAQFFGGETPTTVPSSTSPSRAKSADTGEESEELKKLPGVLVIDAVIIRQKTSLQESRGVNLLRQLQITFSGTVMDYTRSTVPGTNEGITNNFKIHLGDGTPGSITYSLNIANNTDSRTEVLARPSITVVDAETGTFFLGEEVTYTVSGDNADSFDKEVGITFEVTPELLDDGKVRLEANAEFDTFTTKDSGVGFDNVIPTLKNKITSTAILDLGQTLVLGGGTQEEKSKSSNSTPVLGRLPLLQYLFNEQTSVQADTSLIFLITPRLAETIDDQSSVEDASAEEGKPVDQALMSQLRRRFRHWFDPTNNMTKALIGLSYSDLYREFRDGDLKLSDEDADGDFEHLMNDGGDAFLNTYEEGFWPELLRYFYFN